MFAILGEILAFVTVFIPVIEVVTLRLRGWCMLGVFLLPAFTRLGHERQDLLSPCGGMNVRTDQTSVYTLIRKSFGGMESGPMLSPGEKSPLPGKNLSRGGWNPRRCMKQDSELPPSYCGPRVSVTDDVHAAHNVPSRMSRPARRSAI